MKTLKKALLNLSALSCLAGPQQAIAQETFTIVPTEYVDALRNPMKGFRPLTEHKTFNDEYTQISHTYFGWSELENDESDTIQKIKDICNEKWAGVAERGIKVVPSIFLHYPTHPELEYAWPADMAELKYEHPDFDARLARLIARLGECWDNDPRVAWVETSIIGEYGEQHTPSPTANQERIIGDAFTTAFQNKKFLVRHAFEFEDYEVGYYWGSWAHGFQMLDPQQGPAFEAKNIATGRWKTHPLEGELAYDWGTPDENLGGTADATLTTPAYLERLLDSIYNFHCTGLGSVSGYDQTNPASIAAANEVQKAFGYRYLIEDFTCSKRVEPGENMQVNFSILNTGSSPFYADWPVEFSLLDPNDRSVVFKTILAGIDIRDWLPGDNWDEDTNLYLTPAVSYSESASVSIPATIAQEEYIVSLAILDPAGMEPAVRFAINNYFNGGRHPLGVVGIGMDVSGNHEMDSAIFDDPMQDEKLTYEVTHPKESEALIIASTFDRESSPNNPWDVHVPIVNVEFITHESWIAFEGFDFGNGADRFSLNVASPENFTIELRLGGEDGPMIGSVDVPNTGGNHSYQDFEISTIPTSGVQDLYLRFIDPTPLGGYLGNVHSFRFSESTETFTVTPEEYSSALRNPMKGFRPDTAEWNYDEKYASITRCYIKWNEIENDESDTIQKIKDYCDAKWAGVVEKDIKVIPRVYLDWDENSGNEYWPADMTTGDYTSQQFQDRLVRLISRLGQCWDNDPRVAWVQLGIIGQWGEHHSPSPTEAIQTLMGDAITAAFQNKKVLVRHPDEFTDYQVGIYWDSWAHINQINGLSQGRGIELSNQATERWKAQPIEGEIAYNWGDFEIQPGADPNDTLTDPVHRDFLIDTIRNLHCTGLGWVADYDQENVAVQAGAAEVQEAFGYRFVVTEFKAPRRVESDENLSLSLSVKNTGSAPFYENWPVEVSLLDPVTRSPLWKSVVAGVDIREWLPGDDWDEESNLYLTPAETYTVNLTIQLPGKSRLPDGEYIVALSVLDPVGRKPSLRFATTHYFNGGRHPFGMIGVGVDVDGAHEIAPETFNDPQEDLRPSYATEEPAPPMRATMISREISENQVHFQARDSGMNEVRVIQRSFDLKNWTAMKILPGTGATFEWSDVEYFSAFYRVGTE